MADKLNVLQKIAAERKVKLTLETHANQLTEHPADAVWLCKAAPGVGLTLDPSHYYAGPNQGKPYDEVYPYVMGTGFRAGGMEWKTVQMPWGEGPIDFVAIVRNLESHGYKGYYVAEYIEGFNELDAVAESRKFLEWTKTLE
jgi:sugar phosphate isomerase/epimerase